MGDVKAFSVFEEVGAGMSIPSAATRRNQEGQDYVPVEYIFLWRLDLAVTLARFVR